MRRIWNDFRDHRRDSRLFLLYWVAVYAVHAIPRWLRPDNAADIVAPALHLHLLLPVITGVLIARWRRQSAGRIAGGMLAGAIVLGADFLLLQVPELVDNWLRNWPGGHGDEWGFELPMLLVGIGLFGAVLGLVGAAGVTALNRIAHGPQRASTPSGSWTPMPRNLLLIAGGLAWAVVIVIVSTVIPGVSADTFVHAAPERAATGFVYCAALNVTIGAVLIALTRWGKVAAAKPVAVTSGALGVFLGMLMVQAMAVFWGHGPGMRHVVMACIPCAAGDLVAGTLALIAALRQQQTGRVSAVRA